MSSIVQSMFGHDAVFQRAMMLPECREDGSGENAMMGEASTIVPAYVVGASVTTFGLTIPCFFSTTAFSASNCRRSWASTQSSVWPSIANDILIAPNDCRHEFLDHTSSCTPTIGCPKRARMAFVTAVSRRNTRAL